MAFKNKHEFTGEEETHLQISHPETEQVQEETSMGEFKENPVT